MNLEETKEVIEKIPADETLTPEEKNYALNFLAESLEGRAWQAWAKQEVDEVYSRAKTLAQQFPMGDSLNAQESLVKKGRLSFGGTK